MARAAEIISVLEPLAREHGLELVTVEVTGGGHPTVRVFLDRDGGIDIEAIVAANEWISDALDTIERLSGPYTLEVSSPGIERPLRTREDYRRFVGRRATVRLRLPLDGRTRFTGTIASAEGDNLVLDVDGAPALLPFEDVEHGRLRFDSDELANGNGRP